MVELRWLKVYKKLLNAIIALFFEVKYLVSVNLNFLSTFRTLTGRWLKKPWAGTGKQSFFKLPAVWPINVLLLPYTKVVLVVSGLEVVKIVFNIH